MKMIEIIKTFDDVSIEMEKYGDHQQYKYYTIQLIPVNKQINFVIEYTDEKPDKCLFRIVQLKEIMVNAFMGIEKEPHAIFVNDSRHVELTFEWICELIENAKNNYGGDGYHRAYLGAHGNKEIISVDELPIF